MLANLRVLVLSFSIALLVLGLFGFLSYSMSLTGFHAEQARIVGDTLDTAVLQLSRSLRDQPPQADRQMIDEFSSQFSGMDSQLLVLDEHGVLLTSHLQHYRLLPALSSASAGKPGSGRLELDGRSFIWARRQLPVHSWTLILLYSTGDSEILHFQSTGLPMLIGAILVAMLSAITWLIFVGNNRRFRYDPITQLPNRAYLRHKFRGMARRAARGNVPMSLCVLDINRFKEINNTLGYPLGNRVLRIIGNNLKSDIRQGDFISHLGGDRFAILLQNVDIDNCHHYAERTLSSLRRSIAISGIDLEISACAGFAVFPDHDLDPDNLLQKAEVAMYHGKKIGHEYSIYSDDIDPRSLVKLGLLGELRHALENNELELYYQPKIDIRSGRFVGVESLIRWPHRDMGMISPDEFIPLAERSGLIRNLSRWVLDQATDEICRWRQHGRDLPVAVNLSARDLHDPQLPSLIVDMLQKKNISTSMLSVEITETELMVDPAISGEVIRALHRLGIRIAIDDFGTGYSSLSFLKRLPLHEIKIDRSFVRDMVEDENDQTIVRITIDLANNLGLRVVAEGIESATCLEMLRSLGCDTGQGYHISHPLSSDELARWLRQFAAQTEQSPSAVVPLLRSPAKRD